MDQAQGHRPCHRGRAVVHPQLPEDPHHMGLHRRLRDEQPTPDLRVGAPLRHQPQHRRLPFGQSRPLRPGAELVDKTPRDRRRQNRLAPRRGPHRLGEITPRQVPEQMARRPRLHGPQRDHFEPGGQLPCRAAHFERGRGLVPGRETAYGVGERTAVQVRGSTPGDQRAGLRRFWRAVDSLRSRWRRASGTSWASSDRTARTGISTLVKPWATVSWTSRDIRSRSASRPR